MNVHGLGKCLKALGGYHARILLASFVRLATPLQTACDAPQVYAGTGGAARVVIELDGTNDGVTRRYFYRNFPLDIGLEGAWTGETFTREPAEIALACAKRPQV